MPTTRTAKRSNLSPNGFEWYLKTKLTTERSGDVGNLNLPEAENQKKKSFLKHAAGAAHQQEDYCELESLLSRKLVHIVFNIL